MTRDYFETFKVSVDDSRNFIEIKLSEKVEFFSDQDQLLRFECRNHKCFFATTDSQKLFNHEQGCSAVTQLVCKQIAKHRPCQKIRNELVVEGVIPDPSWHNWHFLAFDCECFMEETFEFGVPRSVHRLVSIGIKSSFGDITEFYLEREDMNPLSLRQLMQDFVSLIIRLRVKMLEFIPASIQEGHKKYRELELQKDFKKLSVAKQSKIKNKRRYLENCMKLKIYGWNSEKYDNNVMWAPLLDILQENERDFDRKNIIRRGTGIMEFTYSSLVFRDFLNFSNPMSLESFSRSCGVTSASKTTFPYEFYHDISELHQMEEFPAYLHFKSSLTRYSETFVDELIEICNEKMATGDWKSVVDIQEFFQFSQEFRFQFENGQIVHIDCDGDLRSQLHTSPKKYYFSKVIFTETCTNMADYLKKYNLNDVILLEECVKTYAKGFFDTWGVNIHSQMSLPGVAQGKFAIYFCYVHLQFVIKYEFIHDSYSFSYSYK